MQKPKIEELIRLSEPDAVRSYLNGENGSFLRQLIAAASILGFFAFMVNLSEARYQPAVFWFTALAFAGLIFLIRGTNFYESNVRHLLMAMIVVLLLVIVLTATDSLARVLLPGIFLPLMLLFCRLTVRQYLAMALIFLATAAWFTLRPGGLEYPKDALPALIASGSSILVIVLLAIRITRRRTKRFLARWRTERDHYLEHTRMQSELHDARAIQLSMLPKNPPRLPWLDYSTISLPATEVGGDYFEYIVLSDQKLAVVVGDVAGHGVASGLVLSGVRSGLHLLRGRLENPLEVLSSLNRMVRETAPERMFVTLQIALIDRESEQLTVGNAGHPPLLLLEGRSWKTRTIGSSALPLGTGLDPGLAQMSASIRAGDTIVLYTDGLLEAHDLQQDCFGQDRLAKQIERSNQSDSARSIRDGILSAVSSFKGDVAQEDDLTLVVLRLR